MNVLILGATGMVGQGVLRECLLDDGVARVVTLGRTATGQAHPKLREIVHADLLDLSPVQDRLGGLDACFYCLGASAAGLSEAEYTRINYATTLSVAETLVRLDPDVVFVYVSGAGTDSTERGRTMWARVKGRTENALLRMPFRSAYMLRPGLIVPMHGVKSKTRLYRAFYTVLAPVLPVLKALFPRSIITTEQLGRAMLRLARSGYPKPVLEAADLAVL
ncbi:MAG TPA: NAD-dependent epimerase/dehydratase family protein [Gemmatimonadaceae bacterium]|nr:NAD-dependent epimerase/dehydratase family protein [Gemmatimonadaceae bacterium]